jgi:hypothetical protein
MNSEKPPSALPTDREPPAAAAARKPYQKPAFQREQVFETMALACGKTNPTAGACGAVRKVS